MSTVEHPGIVLHYPRARSHSPVQGPSFPAKHTGPAVCFSDLTLAAMARRSARPGAPSASGAVDANAHKPVAAAYGHYIGRPVGSGQCVALVHAVSPALGSTARWARGEPVQGNTSLQPGTPIATFDKSGRYANATDGSSHAAIYLGQNANGVQVLDQWVGKPAAVRTIPWTSRNGLAADTGSAFHVVRAG
jgi:hypothetical protein